MTRGVLLAVLLPLALGGCGNSRTRPPDLAHVAAPGGTESVSFPRDGLRLRTPRDWARVPGSSVLVASVFSGPALVAIWRYPRTEPAPTSAAALSQARLQLLGAARARDSHLRVIRSKLVKVAGRRAIELDALERIAGRPRRVRSLHLFAYGAEIVLDEYAPPTVFHTVDHAVFSPLKRSLRLFPAAP